MREFRSLLTIALLGAMATMSSTAAAAVTKAAATVLSNDNQHPAGTLDRGTLTLTLRAGRGTWRPEGPAGPALSIEAFGETASSLMVPAPLIRVKQGTLIAASIANDLATPLLVHGLCARDGTACSTLTVAPGQIGEVRFSSGRTGTYHYWATSMGAPVPFRELSGAFVVDPPEGDVAADRVFVITEWSNLSPEQLGQVVRADDPGEAFVKLQPRIAFMINGRSWPATERLTYERGDTVRWRVINLSSQIHPMHLHGFYFQVDSQGDGLHDVPADAGDIRRVVTQALPPGGTMTLTWVPEREGNWLFHCHIMNHVSPQRRLSGPPQPRGDHHANHDGAVGMAGMILGVTVVAPATARSASPSDDRVPRKLTLVMARDVTGREASFGFVLSGDGVTPSPSDDRLSSPGPALVLRRDEPVEITVINRLGESTALHWHGMELESVYDGVHGWSGSGTRLAPLIEPDQSFVVRFTPPRSGTFMYHTHLHDERQLPLGLYGPMIVIDSGEKFDPATDHVLVIGRRGLDPALPDVLIPATPVVLNGDSAPRFVWKAGVRHRVRLMNITPGDIFAVSLQTSQAPVEWTPVTKDGAPLPPRARVPQPARQTIAVGETYDFELDMPAGRRSLWIEVRSPAGKWEAQGHVIVK